MKHEIRPVYLEVKPPENIDRIAIDAGADGSLIIDAHTTNISGNRRLQGQVKKLSTEKMSENRFLWN